MLKEIYLVLKVASVIRYMLVDVFIIVYINFISAFLLGLFRSCLLQGGHQITKTKFPDFSMTFPDFYQNFQTFFRSFSQPSFFYFMVKKPFDCVILFFLLIPCQVTDEQRGNTFSPTLTRNLRCYIKGTIHRENKKLPYFPDMS